MITFIVWIFAGAIIGWLTTYVMRRRHPILLLNIIVGSISAFLAGFWFAPMFHVDNTGLNLPSLMVVFGGTIVLLGLFNFIIREHTVSNIDIEGKWAKVRNKIHVRWGKLTEEDIEQINGKHDKFIEVLQERYGCDEEKAEDELQGYLRAVV
jgi:uncharacterized membrane protein YeaQ/YmgE (transglycosylase-associated protein family)/uncharacterized protein YjbJ (UPF0337 family)